MKRFATKKDYLDEQKFCCFGVTIDENGASVQSFGTQQIKKDPRNNDLRFGPHGMIQYTELGVVKLQSSSACCFSGVIIDYDFNKEKAQAEAVAELHRKREEFVEQLSKQIHSLSRMKVKII